MIIIGNDSASVAIRKETLQLLVSRHRGQVDFSHLLQAPIYGFAVTQTLVM
jgi:hypothetical protein